MTARTIAAGTAGMSPHKALDRIVDAFGGHRSGNQWMVRCPAHDDRNPSLSVCIEDGRLLVHCFAGCAQDNVIAALHSHGLWPSRGGDLPPEPYSLASLDVAFQRAANNASSPNPVATKPDPEPTCVYVYTDEQGKYLYEIRRFEPGLDRPGQKKSFKQGYSKSGIVGSADDWNDPRRYTKRKHPRQVLYRLHKVIKAEIVFLVEGERDVETLEDYGFIATTNAGGAKAEWLPCYTEALRGREVILIPDSDAAGKNRARTVAEALLGRCKLRWFPLPADIKDITEWFESGRSEVELIHLLEEAEAQ